MIKRKNAFTLVETITAFIVMLLVVSSVSLAITLALKVNREQKMTNVAQSIATDIINKLVRNQSFEYLYNYTDTNGFSIKNNGVYLANLTVNSDTGQYTSTANLGVEIDKGFVKIPISSEINANAIQSQTFPDLKLLENGTATLKLYPIVVAYNNGSEIIPISATSTNVGIPIISDTKIAVKAVVRWGKINQSTGLPAFKIESSTVVSQNGLYSIPTTVANNSSSSPSSTPSSNPSDVPTSTPTPAPTPTPSPSLLPSGASCTSGSQCQSGQCIGNPKKCK
ncbi:MAG: hypothetical protein KatS3mg068_1309 [Candidatus Sericytochromatia bacterium]|nr:MAG: hypothetical protein KatS3mg068_1309 [Candidatus Sericytochromatia bacterium]